MTLRVLTVTNMWPTAEHRYYGIFVRDHVEALRRLGLEVDVFFTDARAKRQRYLLDLPELSRRVRSGTYDVIHAHHTYSVLQLVSLPRRPRGVPLVLTLHEGEARLPPGARNPGEDLIKRLVYVKYIKRFALRRSDCVVTVDPALPPAVGHRGPHVVVAPGVDVSLFRPMDQRECRARLGMPEDEAILFFPASRTLLRSKGVDLLEAALAELPTAPRVVFGGGIAREDMPVYMNAADVVVQTSRFEASPMAVKEAMACNRPVVSTEVGDVAALFSDTPGCFLASLDPRSIGDATERALDHDGPVRTRERILDLALSVDDVAARYAALYRHAAADVSRAVQADTDRTVAAR